MCQHSTCQSNVSLSSKPCSLIHNMYLRWKKGDIIDLHMTCWFAHVSKVYKMTNSMIMTVHIWWRDETHWLSQYKYLCDKWRPQSQPRTALLFPWIISCLVIDVPFSVWCNGLTSFRLHVSPSFSKPFVYAHVHIYSKLHFLLFTCLVLYSPYV